MTNEPAIIIFTTDANLIVSSWDDWLVSITGLTADAARGQPLTTIVPDLEASGALRNFKRVLEAGAIEMLDPAIHPYLIKCAPLRGETPSRPSQHFDQMQQRVKIAPLRDGGEIVGTIVTIEDVTALHERQRDLSLQLASPNEGVRLQAVFALATAEALEPELLLVSALGDVSWRVRRAAVDGLALRGGSSMATNLLRSLREEHRNPSVLNGVLQVLAHGKVDTIPALVDCLNDPDVDLRIYAALALGEQHDRRAIPALIRALEDPDLNVRYHAIDALGHLRAAEAEEALIRIAESRDFFLAFPALDALTRIGDPMVAPSLVPLLEDELLCTAAANALGHLGDASAVQPLAQLLNKPGVPVLEIVEAIANLYNRYETAYREGSYIADLARAMINPTGVQNILDALREANLDELSSLVLILGQLEGPAVERALTQLLSQAKVRSKVVEALVRYGKRVTELLIEQLSGEDLEIRQAVVVALGQIGDARAVPALTCLLTKEPELTIATAHALAQIGDRRAFDTLLSLIGHPDAAVRQAVVAALNSLGHPAMLARTIDLLQDKDPNVRESAVKIAGYFAFNECVTLLLGACRDSDENVRRAAIELIPYLENGPVLPTLVRALQNEPPKVRAAAARALGQMESTLAFPYLLSALRDPDAWVRYYAARSIGWHGYPEAVEALAHLAQSDVAHQVRISAVEALGRVGGGRAVTVLAPIAETSSSDLARAALTALGEIGHPNSLPPLLVALRSPDPDRRLPAIRALGKRGGAGVESAIAGLATTDPDVRAVQAAIQALAQLATPEAIAALLELTANPMRNEACIAALANLGSAQIEAVGRGLRHTKAGVRCAVVEVLTRMKHPRASELLIAALEDKDTSVRLRAVQALEHLGNRDAERKLAVLAHTDPDLSVRRAAQKGIKN